MKVILEKARVEDAELLIDIRNKSFYSDYLKYGECPGYNIALNHMKETILKCYCYKIIFDNKVVGNLSFTSEDNNSYYIGCLCVVPQYENKGIGKETIRLIEEKFSEAKIWSLETPKDKLKNIYFYEKLGYKIVKEPQEGSVKLVKLEKII